MDTLSLVVYVLAIAWLALVLVAYLVPYMYGLPPTPTRRERIRQALKLAELKRGETIYDLGAGDGRVLVIAAQEFGAQAVGIDAGPVQCLQSWLNGLLHGLSSRVRVRCGDFFKADLSEADVVFAYLTSSYAERLEPQLVAQLKHGARVVTISFDFPNWEPVAFDKRELIFLYRMPPQAGSLSTYIEKRQER